MNAPSKKFQEHRESADRYQGEIYRLGNWRIAVCKDQLQWLIQRRTRAQSLAGPRWVSKKFCCTRKALIRDWANLTGDDGATVLALLPEHIARC